MRATWGLWQCDAQFLGEDFDYVSNADLVASDDHLVVLSVPDALVALREHREVLVTDCGMDRFKYGVVTRSHVVRGYGNFPHPTLADAAVGRLAFGQRVDNLHADRAVGENEVWLSLAGGPMSGPLSGPHHCRMRRLRATVAAWNLS